MHLNQNSDLVYVLWNTLAASSSNWYVCVIWAIWVKEGSTTYKYSLPNPNECAVLDMLQSYMPLPPPSPHPLFPPPSKIGSLKVGFKHIRKFKGIMNLNQHCGSHESRKLDQLLFPHTQHSLKYECKTLIVVLIVFSWQTWCFSSWSCWSLWWALEWPTMPTCSHRPHPAGAFWPTSCTFPTFRCMENSSFRT